MLLAKNDHSSLEWLNQYIEPATLLRMQQGYICKRIEIFFLMIVHNVLLICPNYGHVFEISLQHCAINLVSRMNSLRLGAGHILIYHCE